MSEILDVLFIGLKYWYTEISVKFPLSGTMVLTNFQPAERQNFPSH